MYLNRIFSLFLFFLCCHNPLCYGLSHEELVDEQYRHERLMEERAYVNALENGNDATRPYANEVFDRAHDYESILGY